MRYRVNRWEAGDVDSILASLSSSGASVSSQVTGASAQLQSTLNTQINGATGAAKSAYQQVLSTVKSYDPTGSGAQAAAGIVTAAQGGEMTDAQIQAGFTAAATAGAIVLGATATAAASVVAPLAAAVYAGGYAIGQLVQNILGITNAGPVACSGNDHDPRGAAPGAPNWVTYAHYYGPQMPANTPGTAGPNALAGWMPYSQGAFEAWARPIVLRAEELWANCKVVPPDNTTGSFAKGLLSAWNARFPGVAIRQVSQVGLGSSALDAQVHALTNTSYPTSSRPALYWQFVAWQGDPIQVLLGQVSSEAGQNVAFGVANPTPAQVAASVPASLAAHVARSMSSVTGPGTVFGLADTFASEDHAAAARASAVKTAAVVAVAGVGALAILQPALFKSLLLKAGLSL